MENFNEIIYGIASNLQNTTGLNVIIEPILEEFDGILTFHNYFFAISFKKVVKPSNLGLVISQINESQAKINKPIILFSNYLTPDIQQVLVMNNISFADFEGNAYIKHKDLFIFIRGQKRPKTGKIFPNRIFQESGIRLIFHLFHKPECIEYTYRGLSQLVDISLGSVSNVMKELETSNFILITESKKVLKNKNELLNRWIIAYNEVLKPRLLKKKMRFINIESYKQWQNISLKNNEGSILWGGEPAAALLTNYLKPEIFTIYTDLPWQQLVKNFEVIPDDDGDIEVYQIFWIHQNNNKLQIVPSVLVYSDLISTGNNRNIETAKIIYNNELQYIK